MINSIVSRANEQIFSNCSNEFWNSIGEIFTGNPKFKPSYYEGVYITRVWISLRKIGVVVDFGANHWGVVFKLSNGKYGITQFDTTGKIELLDNYNSLEAASLQTWGLDYHVMEDVIKITLIGLKVFMVDIHMY